MGSICATVFAAYGCREQAPMGGTPTRLILLIALAALSLQGMTLLTHFTSPSLLLLPPSWAVPA